MTTANDLIIVYILASIAGLIVIISLFKEKQTKKAIVFLILYINVVHIGVGLHTVLAVKAGHYPLTDLLVNQTFINEQKDDNPENHIDQLIFGEPYSVCIYTANEEKETIYSVTDRDQFSLAQSYNGLTHSGKIKNRWGQVTITLTSPSGTMVFIKNL